MEYVDPGYLLAVRDRIEVLPSGEGFVVETLDESSTASIRVYVNGTHLLE